ncbi:unnamed protein product [Fraxinus pennsylvanica]|uniref:DUF2828 domain-containing protein n=1 Tax=Fraxinus pennsylvanica TaxID=56036 RepID=A0AAD1Z9V7_9LAMI|nr:unnamed protein product [Fraxinus pennsylvanica]
MAITCRLLDPPELHHATPSSTNTTEDDPKNSLINQTTDFDLSDVVEEDFEYHPIMGLTENNSATFISLGNPCLDFFFHVVPDTSPKDLIGRLELDWAYNSLTALKLICNLRGVRGTGKSDKEGFYAAAFWLHHYPPQDAGQ